MYVVFLFPQVTEPCRRRRVDAPRRVAAAPAPVGEQILQLIESQVGPDFTLSWSNEPIVPAKGKSKGKVVTVGGGGTLPSASSADPGSRSQPGDAEGVEGGGRDTRTSTASHLMLTA